MTRILLSSSIFALVSPSAGIPSRRSHSPTPQSRPGLEDYESTWLGTHHHHHDPEDDNDPRQVRFGRLEDYNPDSDENGPDHLLRCCRSERLRKKAVRIVLKAEGEHEFIAVHD